MKFKKLTLLICCHSFYCYIQTNLVRSFALAVPFLVLEETRITKTNRSNIDKILKLVTENCRSQLTSELLEWMPTRGKKNNYRSPSVSAVSRK